MSDPRSGESTLWYVIRCAFAVLHLFCIGLMCIGEWLYRHRTPVTFLLLCVLTASLLYLNSQHSRHSFRVEGTSTSGTQAFTLENGEVILVPALAAPYLRLDNNVVRALVQLDSGHVAVYSQSRDTTRDYGMCISVLVKGHFSASVTTRRQDSALAGVASQSAALSHTVRIGGWASSVEIADQTLGSEQNLRRYGVEVIPSDLMEWRWRIIIVAGALFVFAQLLGLLWSLKAEKARRRG